MPAPARSLVGFAWSLVDVTNSETIGHEGELIYVTKDTANPKASKASNQDCHKKSWMQHGR